jgi:hypothetical protein
MIAKHKSMKSKPETGAAMLIAIFALLLISVVAIALLVSSSTDTTLSGNYRTSTSAYYAALAGLEEGRGRLSLSNPDFINNNAPNFLSPPGSPVLGPTQLLYILNPANGESVVPTDLSNPYFDQEYSHEFGGIPPDPSAPMISSTLSGSATPGPMYKWVRITPATSASMGVDVLQSGTPPPFSNSVLYYDAGQVIINNGAAKPIPSFVSTPAQSTAQQAIEITALAVLPNNTQKLMQYVVVPRSPLNTAPNGQLISISGFPSGQFPAALTLVGNGVSYTGPDSASFKIEGNDHCGSPPPPTATGLGWAIGYTSPGDYGAIVSGITAHPELYTGAAPSSPPPPAPQLPATPSVGSVSFPFNSNPQSVTAWEAMLQSLRLNSDVYLKPIPPSSSVPGSALPPSSIMTAANPMKVFVDGDLDLTGWHPTGYGLLVVTGNLNYDPDASWEGVVLVIGKGTFTAPNHSGNGRIDGAMLVAKTRDAGGSVLSSLGAASVMYDSSVQGQGIYYNSCWIKSAMLPTSYKILSFREIPYP